jgi:hypothetical protein
LGESLVIDSSETVSDHVLDEGQSKGGLADRCSRAYENQITGLETAGH